MNEPSYTDLRRGPKFDWTVNFGHILTFVGFIASGFALYATLDKRIQRIEDLAPFMASSRDEKDRAVQASITALTTDVKDVKASVDRMVIKLEVQNAINERPVKK